jgi:hypothetical protein
MMEAIQSSETSVLTRAHGVTFQKTAFFSHHLKSYIALTGWALKRRRNMFPLRYELGFYIPDDGVLHSPRREHLISYNGQVLAFLIAVYRT